MRDTLASSTLVAPANLIMSDSVPAAVCLNCLVYVCHVAVAVTVACKQLGSGPELSNAN